ncbi:MAG TPA: RnfABCDGE type electron transport complex subunit D, partial [Spirochaetales bacterium]|nr:RnfABCDGE type electron transport complex subunit D [Spirochaetales bacterium]
TEFLFERAKGGKTSEAVLVSGTLLALSMPPAAPLWLVALASAFGVFMAKEVYGGFGRNIFNPAIAGRLFVYISFAALMGQSFYQPGSFGQAAGSLFGQPDAISGATPLAIMRDGGSVPILDLLLGTRSGAIGESSIVLLAAIALYLVATKTAQWRLIVSTLGSGAALCIILWMAGVPGALPPQSLLAGSFVFVAVLMSTDPVSAPKKKGAQWAYGSLIGASVIVIRSFSLFSEGTSFAVLLGNSFASMFDRMASQSAQKRKAKTEAAAKEAGK